MKGVRDISILLDLESIDGVVSGIRDHWELVTNGPYQPLGFEPAEFYRPWLTRTLGDDWLTREHERKLLLDDGGHIRWLASKLVPVLAMSCRELKRDIHNCDAARGARILACTIAHELSEKATREALSEAELNQLGWNLTTLVALSDETLLQLLADHRRAAGRKGGQRSAATRAEQFEVAAEATCETARKILAGRQLSPSHLVAVLAGRSGLSKPTVIKHLRTQSLYPPKKKKRS